MDVNIWFKNIVRVSFEGGPRLLPWRGIQKVHTWTSRVPVYWKSLSHYATFQSDRAALLSLSLQLE